MFDADDKSQKIIALGVLIRVLHVGSAGQYAALLELFPTAPGNAAWSDVIQGPLDEFCGRFDICLDGVDGGGRVRRNDLDICVVCDDFDCLIRLTTGGFEGTVIFSPSPVTLLDAGRKARKTLVAVGALEKGVLLTDAHMDAVEGGQGVGADCRAAMIGRRTAYAIEAGEALDFGKVR